MSSPRKICSTAVRSPKKGSPLRNINSNVQSAPNGAVTKQKPGRSDLSSFNPNRILAKHRRTLDLDKCKTLKRAVTEDENDSGVESGKSAEAGNLTKRFNPFGRQNSTPQVSDVPDIYSGSLSQSLSEAVEISPLVDHLRKNISLPGFTVDDFLEHETEKTSQPAEVKKNYIPYKEYFDWSLKTTLRITTKADLRFIKDLNGQDRVHAACNTRVVTQGARFLRQLRVFTFPALHGVRTFPRSVQSLPLGESYMDWKKFMPNLQQNWDTAVEELLDGMKLDLCPYFYIVTHQWSALVLSKDFSQTKTMRAFAGPTNMGFRASVKEKGIRFTMPLRASRIASASDKDSDELNSSGGSDSLTDSKGTSWITEQCKQVGRVFVEDAVDVIEQELDNKPESLLMFDDDEVVNFVSALVKFKTLIPTGGPLVNVPPTLIAPTPFTGAVMERNSHRYRRTNGMSYLEISGGPVLPHVIPSLVHLIGEDGACARSEDHVDYATHDGTVVLTRITVPDEKPHHQINPETQSITFADVQLPAQRDGQSRQVPMISASSQLAPPEVMNLMRLFPFIG